MPSPFPGMDPYMDPPLVVTVAGVEIHEGFIEIIQRGEPGHVVTAIEVLRPSNKAPGRSWAKALPGQAKKDPLQRDSSAGNGSFRGGQRRTALSRI